MNDQNNINTEQQLEQQIANLKRKRLTTEELIEKKKSELKTLEERKKIEDQRKAHKDREREKKDRTHKMLLLGIYTKLIIETNADLGATFKAALIESCEKLEEEKIAEITEKQKQLTKENSKKIESELRQTTKTLKDIKDAISTMKSIKEAPEKIETPPATAQPANNEKAEEAEATDAAPRI